MVLPADLRTYAVDLAGRLVLAENPGEEVRALRTRYGFTQAWVSDQVDLRRESLSRIESGHVNLSLAFLQRFVRVMTLARAVREHLAQGEVRRRDPDEVYLSRLASDLRLPKAVGDEVIVASMVSYQRKRRTALRGLGNR